MANYDDKPDDRRPRQIVEEHMRRGYELQEQYEAYKTQGEIPDSLIQKMAAFAMTYQKVLAVKRTENVLTVPWEERPIHWLEEYMNSTVTIEKSLPRSNGASKEVERPAVLAVDAHRIDAMIDELHDIANELGITFDVYEQEAEAQEV